MIYEFEINDKLGSENVGILQKEIQNARIQYDELKQMAKYMDDNVFGVFVQNEKQGHASTYLFKMMLDSWYNISLHKNSIEEAQTELRNILLKVGLHAIAYKLEIGTDSEQRER